MGKDLFFIALGGKGTKWLIALFMFAVLFAAGQATRLNMASGSYHSMHFFFFKEWPHAAAFCTLGHFFGGRVSWLSTSLCSSAVHIELVFHRKAL